jgi:hypothetical protein
MPTEMPACARGTMALALIMAARRSSFFILLIRRGCNVPLHRCSSRWKCLLYSYLQLRLGLVNKILFGSSDAPFFAASTANSGAHFACSFRAVVLDFKHTHWSTRQGQASSRMNIVRTLSVRHRIDTQMLPNLHCFRALVVVCNKTSSACRITQTTQKVTL